MSAPEQVSTGPPENESGRLDPTAKKLRDTPQWHGRYGCQHSDTRIEILPPGSYHFAKERCTNCDRTLRFLPKPENVERRRVTAYRMAKMLMAPGLTKWETQFLSSGARQQKFSPRQAAVLERLWDQIFGDR